MADGRESAILEKISAAAHGSWQHSIRVGAWRRGAEAAACHAQSMYKRRGKSGGAWIGAHRGLPMS